VADKLAAALKAQQGGFQFVPETQKLGRYLDDWLEYVRPTVRPRTWQRYEQYVRLHIKPSLARLRLVRLTPQHLTRLYAERQAAGFSPTTVVHLHRVIHEALKQAVRWGLVPRNVADLVDPPRMAHKEMRTLSASEARAFLLAASEDPHEALFVLAVTTGM
jgi:integrase